MYMVSLYLTASKLTCLTGLAGFRPQSVSGRRSSVAYSSAIRHCSLWTGVALTKTPGACGGASAWTTKTDTGLSFQTGNPFGRFVASNIDQRSELDANPVFARILAFDPVAGCDAGRSDHVLEQALASLRAYAKSCGAVFPPSVRGGQKRADRGRRYLKGVYCDGNVSRRL
jgi:hypothetical protein